MKNIEYLEKFFKKHKLKGKIKVKYSKNSDEYMTDIIFENGDVININDVIFDIESDLDESVAESWLEYKRENDISLMDWMQTDNHYILKNMDTSSIDEYKNEVNEILDGVKNMINNVFTLKDDIEDDTEDDIEKETE